MSSEIATQERSGPLPARPRASGKQGSAMQGVWGLRLVDASLVGLFLALTFLLGIFPLKDADYYWHLRTGDLIRKSGEVPRADFYTFTRQGTPWIDLHWIFQVGISWLLEHGGVNAIILAKAAITCLAVLLLVTARRRSWPIWAMLLAWIPALLVLSGRMYIRPETLSLLYLSAFLAVLCRWEQAPWLVWILPLVQVAWVNSHGLFVLGPVVLGFGLIDAAFRRGAFAPERRRWWQIVVAGSAATGLACLVNPYGIHGAVYPLVLAGTMSNPIFRNNIAELTPIPEFIKRAGLWNLPLLLHLLTMVVGAISFLVPLLWLGTVRLRTGKKGTGESLEASARKSKSKGKKKLATKSGAEEPGWRISPLRLLLFASFSLLSFQATRNSHQFAAVLGTITAWNFAEWVAARRRLLNLPGGREGSADTRIAPRLVTLLALLAVFVWVGSGQFYALAGEGRRIAWGEEPLWFAHDATRLAGEPGMPERFLCFHNGHASLFEYYFSPEREGGPGRTVFTDPRLEVNGPELFDRYRKLQQRINDDQPGWEADLDSLGRPSILVDHVDNSQVGARLLGSRHYRCVWFDPIAAVFVHDSYAAAVKRNQVDFAARHFRPDPTTEPHGLAALLAMAKGLRNYVSFFSMRRTELVKPMAWLGLDYARRIVEIDATSSEGWKTVGLIELFRDPMAGPSPRFKMPFDPVFDLATVRATYALRRARELAPRDFMSLLGLQNAFESRQMDEALLPVLDSLIDLHPINQHQSMQQVQAEARRTELNRKLGSVSTSPREWRNLGELEQMVAEMLATGRAESAAVLLERAYPPEQAPWEIADRVATLWLHLGQAERARDIWRKVAAVPRPAVREARVAVTYLSEGHFNSARAGYEKALEAEPDLFEAHYGLAILEQDAGRAAASHAHALAAIETAPGDVSRSAARALAAAVARFAEDR